MRDFKSIFHLYDSENNEPTSIFGWLSMMQHYGVPTRLIDFTISPFTALYFALETFLPSEGEDNIAVYAINYTKLNEIFLDQIRAKNNKYNAWSIRSVYENAESVYEDIMHQPIDDDILIFAAEPYASNARIDRQGCTFLITNCCCDIIRELSSDKYTDIDFCKYVINRSLYSGIYDLLRKMNITSKTLYGNLSGLSKKIQMDLVYYSEICRSNLCM